MSSPSLLLEDQLCFRFYTVVRLITRLYQPHLDRLGLTYPQYLVLLVLWEQDGVPLSHIVDRLGLNTNTLTPLLKRLEAAGFVTRRPCVRRQKISPRFSPASCEMQAVPRANYRHSVSNSVI